MFDVVIPTFNNLSQLKKCLFSLESERALINKVIVSVDGSTDGTWEWLNDFNNTLFSLVYIRHEDEKNHGRQVARNIGFEHTNAEYIIFLDSDFEIRQGLLSAFEKEISRHDVVVSHIRFLNNADNHWAHYLTSRQKKIEDKSSLPVRYYVSGCVAIKRSVFKKAGKFNELITSYGGDLAFSIQLEQSGVRSVGRPTNAIVEGLETKNLVQVIEQHKQIAEETTPIIMKEYPSIDSYPYSLDKLIIMKRFLPLKRETVADIVSRIVSFIPTYLRPGKTSDTLVRVSIILTMIAFCDD